MTPIARNLLLVCLMFVIGGTIFVVPTVAWADGDKDEHGSGEHPDIPPPPPPPPPRAIESDRDDVRPTPPKLDHSSEIVVAGKRRDVLMAERLVVKFGGTKLRRHRLDGLGVVISVVAPGSSLNVENLAAALQKDKLEVTVAANAGYAPAGDAQSYVATMVGLDPTSVCGLVHPVRVGVIDGPVDASNIALTGAMVESRSVLPWGDAPGSSDHATAIVALIAARGGQEASAGIAVGAQIFAAGAFALEKNHDVARVESIAMAINWFVEEHVPVVNLSLAGPFNPVLQSIIGQADDLGLTMVASAGNDGKPTVSYPASDPHVIGVTAVDVARGLYRKANTGDEIDFAAPGVDVLVPGKSGEVYRSGTSYATAVVTGLVARQIAKGRTDRATVTEALRAAALDLGAPGHDAKFGWGLVRAGGC